MNACEPATMDHDTMRNGIQLWASHVSRNRLLHACPGHVHIGAEFLADEAAGQFGGEEGQEEDLSVSVVSKP